MGTKYQPIGEQWACQHLPVSKIILITGLFSIMSGQGVQKKNRKYWYGYKCFELLKLCLDAICYLIWESLWINIFLDFWINIPFHQGWTIWFITLLFWIQGWRYKTNYQITLFFSVVTRRSISKVLYWFLFKLSRSCVINLWNYITNKYTSFFIRTWKMILC